MSNKALFIGGGIALYLLRDHIAQALGFSTAGTVPTQVIQPTDPGSQGTTAAAVTTPAPTGVWPQVQALGAKQGETLSPDQWLYVYRVFRGSDTTTPESLGMQHDRLYTFDEFKAAMTSKGLNGIRQAPAAPRPRANAQSFGRRAWGY